MSIFKNTLIKEVQDQLTIRQNSLRDRSNNIITTLNSRNSWCRMTSAVNVNNSADLAKRYILQGGLLSSTGQMRSGIGDQDSAYSNISPSGQPYRLGIRPMPGIVNLDVQSKSAYGSLREVKIDFECWDIRQLEDLEILYMRPGFTCLIEWGWSPYLDNKGNTQTTIPYYDILNGNKTKEQIFKDLFEKSKTLNGNYDAMYGYVKNYGWEARPDGGYNCYTVIISIGEIMESLKINYAPFSSKNDIITKGVTGLLNDANLTEQYSKNILAGLFYEFQYLAENKLEKTGLSDSGQIYPFKDLSSGQVYDFFIKKLNLSNDNNTNKITSTSNQVYIRFGSLVDLLNKYVLLSDKKTGTPLVQLSLKDRKYDKDDKTDKSLLCLAHPLQISVDPSICLIKNNFWINAKFNSDPVGTNNIAGNNQVVKFSQKDYHTLIQYLFDEILGSNPENINKQEIQQKIQQVVGSNYFDTKEFSRQFWQDRKQYHISSKSDIKKRYGYSDNIINTKYQTNKLGTSISSNFANNKTVGDLFDGLFTKDELTNKIFPGANPKVIPNSEKTVNIPSPSTAPGSIPDLTPLYNDLLFGIDPTVYENQKIKQNQTKYNINPNDVENIKFLSRLKPYFLGDNNKNELGVIENYYINLQFLYSLSLDTQVTNNDKKDKNDLQLYDFLKNITQAMQNSTGNVNNFDIHVDPIDNIARIIDVNYVDELQRIDVYNNAFIIELQGLKSTARNYSLKSNIFPEQSTIIAISAQGGGGQLGTDNNTMIAFHKNLSDRIIPYKDSPTVDPTLPSNNSGVKIDILNKSLEKLYQYFGDLGQGIFSAPGFNVANIEDYKNSLKDIIAFFKGLLKSDSKNRNIIPTKLNIELDGIGGLVIGHLFRIPLDLLPTGYKGDNGIGSKIGYIITGIGHKITKDWTTSIDSQIIILDEPFGEVSLSDIIFIDPATGENTINLAYDSKGTVVINKPSIQDYKTKFDNTIVNPGKVSQVDHIVDKIVANKTRYVNISQLSGGNTPWHIIGIIHYNECNLSFSHHLHNGDPLSGKTIRVPSGRIPGLNPPYKFEDSAIDALKVSGFTTRNMSDIPNQLYALEAYNGFGYSQKGVNSPYIWSFTNQYTSGKFIADHVFSQTAISDQTGAAAILKRMKDRGIIS